MKTTLIYLVLGAIMGIGGMAILQASTRAQAEDTAKAEHVRHCEIVNQQVLAEFDELIAKNKFPSQDQQDYWRQITKGCEE